MKAPVFELGQCQVRLRSVLPERQFIERLRLLAGKAKTSHVVRGIGDDCAILKVPSAQQLLVTTDFCIEGVHFRRAWHPAESVGHRCLARGLSDIAAMGGNPVACFLSLAVPASLPVKWVNDFFRGLLQLARRFHVSLAGGDTSSASRITADVTVLGSIPAGRAILRSTARAGDKIYLSGSLGESAHVLRRLYRGDKVKPAHNSKHYYPLPRIEVGRQLRERNLASSMIDMSDGLSVDLAHLCEESSVSAIVDSNLIPVARDANLDFALHGGDEYELLFTARPGLRLPDRIAGVPITMIGRIVPEQEQPTISIRDRSGHIRPLAPGGWQHFRKI